MLSRLHNSSIQRSPGHLWPVYVGPPLHNHLQGVKNSSHVSCAFDDTSDSSTASRSPPVEHDDCTVSISFGSFRNLRVHGD